MYRALNVLGVLTVAFAMTVAMGGCGGSDEPINPGMTSGGGGGTSSGGGSGGEELPDLSGADLDFRPASDLEAIYFDYNRFELRPDSLEALGRNAEKIIRAGNVVIQVEGHCDERGTQEYNLALGEKRALATRQHLVRLGVAADRIITISYGEENPVALGHAEDSWSQNRRCQFNIAM